MSAFLGVLWLLLAFGVFTVLVWSVYAMNRAAARRYGYEPFSLPNAALMLVANLLLLSALAPSAPAASTTLRNQVMLGVAAVLALGLLVVIARRSSLWHGLYAVALMSVGAIAILPSLVFMRLAAGFTDAAITDAGEPSSEQSAAGQGDQAAPEQGEQASAR